MVLVGTLVVGWWNSRNTDKANTNSDDVASANLYLDFKKEFREMEDRLATKYKTDIAEVENRYKAEISTLRTQMARDRAALDFALEYLDPKIANVTRQIQAGELKRENIDITEHKP